VPVAAKTVRTSEKATEMLQFDLDNETETIRNYRERVRQWEELAKYAMSEQIRQILIDEQDHQIALATALGKSVPTARKSLWAWVVLKSPDSRFFDGLLHLTDFILDVPRDFFASTLPFQVGIVRPMTNLLLNHALHFVDLACDLVLSTWPHFVASSALISIPARDGWSPEQPHEAPEAQF
jgi:hypothetical protein